MRRLEELKVLKRHPEGVEFSNYSKGLLDLVEYTKPKDLLEIGSFLGISTEIFLVLGINVTAIDPLNNGIYSEEFLDKCTKYPNFRIIKGYSPKDLNHLPDDSFDMVYIDGEHNE
jgi:predicted O-methyltransferase YrrM